MSTGAKPILDAVDLRNQWARTTDGRLISAIECASGAVYSCPHTECPGELRVRAENSEHMRAHLYHSTPCAAAGESVEHALAKNVAAQAISDWLKGAAPPLVVWPCLSSADHIMTARALFSGATGVVVEGAVGTRRGDVVVHRGDRPPLLVEIYWTHAVDAEKAAELARLCVPYIEVDARDVLAQKAWIIRAHSGLERARCSLCAIRRKIEIAEDAKHEAEEDRREAEARAAEAVRAAKDLAQQAKWDSEREIRDARDDAAKAKAEAERAKAEASAAPNATVEAVARLRHDYQCIASELRFRIQELHAVNAALEQRRALLSHDPEAA